MLKEKSLKLKLLLAFGSISCFVFFMTALSLFSMQKINREYGHIVNVTIGNLQSVSEINTLVMEANRLNLRAYIALIEKDQVVLERNTNEFPKRVEELEKLNAQYRSTPFAPGEEKLYEEVWNAWKSYEESSIDYIKLVKTAFNDTSKSEEASKIVNETLRQKRIKIQESVNHLIEFQRKDSKERSEAANSTYHWSFNLLVIISLFILGTSVGLGLLFSNYMNKALASIAEKIRGSSDQTSVASHELTSASSQLSQGATESAASLEETVSSLEELSSMVKLNSDHAKEANDLSRKSLNSAEHGEKEIKSLLEAMSGMEKSSKKIEEIINVIDDIAFQTNLLALNAAVEAARAGEQGRGFAVVADAVRNLAGRSALAAKDINNLIKENVHMTENGVRIAGTSGSTLKEIVDSAKKVAELNSEISAASIEQANGIEQISKAMNHLDQAIQSNASSSEEVASSASEMSAQSDCLISMVNELRHFVDGGSTEDVKTEQRKSKHVPSSKVVPFKKTTPAAQTTNDHTIGKAEGF